MLGETIKPVSPMALRIDNFERMVNQLNDVEISPTDYMLAYLRQRGWTLPNDSITIPNVLPESDNSSAAAIKPVWRIAFFSRLEERKGIKQFVEAISQLNVSHIPNFEVCRPRHPH